MVLVGRSGLLAREVMGEVVVLVWEVVVLVGELVLLWRGR